MSEVKRYTFAEVSSRDGSNGQPLWIVYKDSVYDLTKYIDEVSTLPQNQGYHLEMCTAKVVSSLNEGYVWQ
ncbi:hypothetical protein HF086_000262 [Spodoptera exigua]|uniref:Cytochrome b5 heme-binding domain-containing protein n=1 Tax=Spodoptera exigua TaxID=7107 RepID=A0A922SBY2_SPOEX|nr:hypothetical protein HF086_000262 [Spodoptera exigua]